MADNDSERPREGITHTPNEATQYALFTMQIPHVAENGEISWQTIGRSIIRIKSIEVDTSGDHGYSRVELAGYRESIIWGFDNNALLRDPDVALREMQQQDAIEHDEQARKLALSKIRGRNLSLAQMLEREFADQPSAERLAQIWVNSHHGKLFVYRASETTYAIDTRDSDLRVSIIE